MNIYLFQSYQFKLERIMDYGPTIASCFGSPDPVELDELRKVLVRCVKEAPKDLRIMRQENFDPQQSIAHVNSMPTANGNSYVYDYETGKSIPISEYQQRYAKNDVQCTSQPHVPDHTVAKGRYHSSIGGM